MDENKTAVEKDQTAAPDEVVITPTTTEEDVEQRLAELEAEKNKAIEEAANWKVAALKAKAKKKDEFDEDEEPEEDRIARIVQKQLAETKIAQIDKEKEELLKKALKENKELKIANLNKKTEPPAVLGTHTEEIPVQSTTITPEQLNAFKARGWTDKDIERYKKNLQRYGGR